MSRWVDVAANAEVIVHALAVMGGGVVLAGFMALLARLRRHYRQRNETVHPPVSGGHVRVPHDSFGLNIIVDRFERPLPDARDIVRHKDKETADG